MTIQRTINECLYFFDLTADELSAAWAEVNKNTISQQPQSMSQRIQDATLAAATATKQNSEKGTISYEQDSR